MRKALEHTAQVTGRFNPCRSLANKMWLNDTWNCLGCMKSHNKTTFKAVCFPSPVTVGSLALDNPAKAAENADFFFLLQGFSHFRSFFILAWCVTVCPFKTKSCHVFSWPQKHEPCFFIFLFFCRPAVSAALFTVVTTFTRFKRTSSLLPLHLLPHLPATFSVL